MPTGCHRSPTWTYKGMNLLTQRNVPGTSEVKTNGLEEQEGGFCQAPRVMTLRQRLRWAQLAPAAASGIFTFP